MPIENIEKEIMKLKMQAAAHHKEVIKIDPYEIASRITNSNYRYGTSYMKIPYNKPYESNHVMIPNSPLEGIIVPYIKDNTFKFIYYHSGGEDFGEGIPNCIGFVALLVSLPLPCQVQSLVLLLIR